MLESRTELEGLELAHEDGVLAFEYAYVGYKPASGRLHDEKNVFNATFRTSTFCPIIIQHASQNHFETPV